MVQTCQANKWQSAVLRGLNWSIRKDLKLFLSLQAYFLWPKQTSQIFQVRLRRGRCNAHLSRQKKAGNCNLASVIGAMKAGTLMVYTSLHTLLTHCSIIKPSYCHVMGCKKSCCEMYPNDALPKWQSPHAACIYFPRLDWFTTTIPHESLCFHRMWGTLGWRFFRSLPIAGFPLAPDTSPNKPFHFSWCLLGSLTTQVMVHHQSDLGAVEGICGNTMKHRCWLRRLPFLSIAPYFSGK